MIKFLMTRQCEVCGEWSSDSSGNYEFTCIHTPEEYRNTLDQLTFEMEKGILDFVWKKEDGKYYEIVKDEAEREK